MDIRKLQRAIVDGLEDVKGQHIAVFNTEHLSALFERVIIATGASNRQTKSLAASVRDSVKKRGMQVMSTEGEENGEWIIVDCGAAVAHIMQPAIRDYYHLEEIWGGKSVRLKAGEGGRPGLVKAGEADATGRRGSGGSTGKAATGKSAAAAGKKIATQTAAPKKSTTGSATAVTAAGKAALTRRVAGGKPAARPPAAKRPAPAATGPAAKKAAANKSAAYKRVGAKRPTGTAAPTSPRVSEPGPARKPAKKPLARPARKAPRAG
ncbi:MAG: ribosome silencing factor [Rubrivivax sp.]